MSVLPHEVTIFDVISEGQMVYSMTFVTANPSYPEQVLLHVGLPRVVERDGYKHVIYDHPKTIVFFNNYETGDMALKRHIPIIRGMPLPDPNGVPY